MSLRLFALVALFVSSLAAPAEAQVGSIWLRDALAPPRPGVRRTPSNAIFPKQEIRLRFSHKQHVEADVDCQMCHDALTRSDKPSDRNLPKHEQCETCHDIEAAAKGEAVDPPSDCASCHPGHQGPDDPPKSVFPAGHLIFAHSTHLARGAKCTDCHSGVEQAGLATVENLPRMVTCLGCHDGTQAPNRCTTCHLSEPDGVLVTRFSSGTLAPTGTLRDDDHGSDFLRRHAFVAKSEMESCQSCHRTSECEACHVSSSKAFRVHPPDWQQTHSVSARGQEMDCRSCHREQEFCLSCHQQLGVAKESKLRQPGERLANARFHPPGFSAMSASSPNHHKFAAQANIQSCTACHQEQTCMQCHAVNGPMASVSPHPAGWRDSGTACRSFKAAPVACAKCHGGGAGLTSVGQLLVECR